MSLEARIQMVVSGDFDPAVRPAGVVDEARDVAADRRVAAPAAVHAEDPDAAFSEVPFLSSLALGIADQFAGVVDDPSVLVDRLEREDA